MRRKLRVVVHPKSRKYRAKTRVMGFVKHVPDKGLKGKGKPFIKKSAVRKNILGEGYFDKSAVAQKRILVHQSQKKGEKAVQGQLQFVANVQKRINPPVAKKAQFQRSWIAKRMEGKKRVY